MSDFGILVLYLTISFIVALFLFIVMYNQTDKFTDDWEYNVICWCSILWPLTLLVCILALPIIITIIIISCLISKKQNNEIQNDIKLPYLDNSEFDFGHNVKSYHYDGEEY